MTDTPAASASPASNPFSTRFVRPGAMDYRFLVDGSWQRSDRQALELVDRLDQVRRGLIVGPHGSGKTTLLHWLGPWLDDRFVDTKHLLLQTSSSRALLARLDHTRRTARTVLREQSRLCEGGLMMLDGAEQLGRVDLARLLRRLRRRGQVILATSHRPLRGLTVLHETNVSVDLAQSLTQSLVAGAPDELVDFVNRELSRRDLSTLTSVRDLWFELYDLVQARIIRPDSPPESSKPYGCSIVHRDGSCSTPDGRS